MEISEFKCEFCTHKFSSKPEWKMHMKAQHGMTVYVCDLCPKVYYGESEYIQHVDAEHKSEFNRHICSICGVSYKWFKFLESHIQKKHQVNKLKQCNKCGEEFYNTLAYKRHMKLKHAPGRVFHKCKKCFRSFTAKSYVVLHEKFDHDPNGLKYFREYASENLTLENPDLLDDLKKCSKCNVKYSSALYLYKHFKLVHNKQKWYQCCKCQDAVYGTRTGVTIHLFHEHNVSREHKCAKCTTALFKKPSNKKVKKEAVTPVVRNKNGTNTTEDGPWWSKVFIKQGIPEDVELNDANEEEISNLRHNIKSVFHILSTVPPSKLKGTTHNDLHVESVFSIHKMKGNDGRRIYEIEANDTEEDDDNNERFLSNAVENENKQLKRKRRYDGNVHGVLTVVKNKDGNERYKCDICHAEFSHRKGLKAHIIYRHGFNGKFSKANFDKVEIEPDNSYINGNNFDEVVSMLVERINNSTGWDGLNLPDEVSEAIQTYETDSSQKENKCDASQKDNDSDTSVNKSDTMQKIAKSENVTPTVNKCNTLQKDNKSTSHEDSNTPNEVEKFNAAPNHKPDTPQKNLWDIFRTPQKANHAKCDSTQKVNTSNTNKTDTCPKGDNSKKTASIKKFFTPQKDNTTDTTQKVDTFEATQNKNKSETSNKVNYSSTPQKESKTASKVNNSETTKKSKSSSKQTDTARVINYETATNNKSNTIQKNTKTGTTTTFKKNYSTEKVNKSAEKGKTKATSDKDTKPGTSQKMPNSDAVQTETPKTGPKSDITRKENKPDTLTKVNECESTQKVNKSNSPRNEQSNTTPNMINSETSTKNKPNALQKDNKSDKDTAHGTPQKVQNSDAIQKETKKSKTSTKVNKSVTTQKVGESKTPQKETTPKLNESNNSHEDRNSMVEKLKKSNATQRKLFFTAASLKINISTSTSKPITPESSEKVDQSATKQNLTITNYKCNFCQIEFEDQLLLLNHLTESHSASEPKDGETVYKCIECGIAFQQQDSLEAHVKVQHPKENTFLDPYIIRCEICNKIFNDTRGLKLHNLRTHNIKNVYSCKKCNYKHSNKRKLRSNPCIDNRPHIIEVENKEKTEQGKENPTLKEAEYEEIKNKLLQMCKKEINSKRAKQDDQKRIYKCLKCESKFPKRASLLIHIKNEHKINLFKIHKCEKCNSVFKMADKLKQHIKMKHKTVQAVGNIPVIKINKSKMSPIKFNNGKMPNILSNLFLLNGKMHTCRICNSYFPSSELLQRHIEWEHTKNVNLHKCGQCAQVLYNVEDLEMHMSNAHNNTDGIFKWKKQIAYNYEQQTDL